MNSTYFYTDKPLFGFDIGFKTMKVMQATKHGSNYEVDGYGLIEFDPKCIENGEIIDYEGMAKSAYSLFKDHIVGEVTTRRAVFSVPAARTFSRILALPLMAEKDLAEAVRLEAEQYIPVPIDDLYLDYTITKKTNKNINVLAVATPKRVIDSYMKFSQVLGLEGVAMETTTSATSRIFTIADNNDVPTVLVDFGSISTDITIYDSTIVVTGTLTGGGDDITSAIQQALGVNHDEAHLIKTKYGLAVSKKQDEIVTALTPFLDRLTKEIKRMVRYYEERSDNPQSKIEQIVTHGGGSNVPGLSEYLINSVRLPARMCDPWSQVQFKHIEPPGKIQQAVYVTAAGLAIAEPRELFI